MTNIWQRINGSWSDRDAYRHWCYEDIYQTLRSHWHPSGSERLVEFGSLEPTTPIIRMATYLYPSRVRCEVTRPFPSGGDILEPIEYAPGSIDCLVLDQVLEHVTDPFRAARNVTMLVKTGGLAIVATPFLFPLHHCPIDGWRYTPEAYRQLFPSDLWQALRLRTWGGQAVVKWWLDHMEEWIDIDRARAQVPNFDQPEYDSKYPLIVWWVGRRR